MFFNVTSVVELELAELIQCRFLPILSLSDSSHILVFWFLVDSYESQLSSLFIILFFLNPQYLKRDQARSQFFYRNKQIWQLTFVAMYQNQVTQNMNFGYFWFNFDFWKLQKLEFWHQIWQFFHNVERIHFYNQINNIFITQISCYCDIIFKFIHKQFFECALILGAQQNATK